MEGVGITTRSSALDEARRRDQNRIKSHPRVGMGVSIGCFAGVGYGLAVGMGKVTGTSRTTAIITPSFGQPFAHEGIMAGAFCGVVMGGGFATGIGTHIGYSWPVFTELYETVRANSTQAVISAYWRMQQWIFNPAIRRRILRFGGKWRGR